MSPGCHIWIEMLLQFDIKIEFVKRGNIVYFQ